MTRMTQTVGWFLAAALCVTLFLPDILLVAFVFGISGAARGGFAVLSKGSRRS